MIPVLEAHPRCTISDLPRWRHSIIPSSDRRVSSLHQLDIPRIFPDRCCTRHGIISPKTGLAPAHHHIQPDGGNMSDCAEDGECEEGLVGATDGDAGRGSPVLCGACGENCAGHAVG